MMKEFKAFEIEGIQDLIVFCLFIVVSVALIVGLPTAFVWVTWNGVVGDMIHGPYIAFWQALILTLALFVLFYLVAKPEIHLEIKKVDGSEEADKLLSQLKKKTDPNEPN